MRSFVRGELVESPERRPYDADDGGGVGDTDLVM
ncbi:hypothetical protein JOD52_000967 [Brachybacterium muris]|nr:hypothetical protein [Brachybacterium muris]